MALLGTPSHPFRRPGGAGGLHSGPPAERTGGAVQTRRGREIGGVRGREWSPGASVLPLFLPFLWSPPPRGGGGLEPGYLAEAPSDLDTCKPLTFPLGSPVSHAPRTCWVLTWSPSRAGLSHTPMFLEQGHVLHSQAPCGSPAGPTGHPLPLSLGLSLRAGGILLIPSEPQAPSPAAIWELNLSPPGQSVCWCGYLGLPGWRRACCRRLDGMSGFPLRLLDGG